MIGPAKLGVFPVNLADLNTKLLLENYGQTTAYYLTVAFFIYKFFFFPDNPPPKETVLILSFKD